MISLERTAIIPIYWHATGMQTVSLLVVVYHNYFASCIWGISPKVLKACVKALGFLCREVGNDISRDFSEKNLLYFLRISEISREFYFIMKNFLTPESREEYRRNDLSLIMYAIFIKIFNNFNMSVR